MTAAPGGPVAVRIRPAGAADLPGVLELWSAAGAPPSPTDDLAGLERLLLHDPDALLVADEAGVLAGSVVAAFDGWRANLYRLAVRPSHRRRGIARALVLIAARRLRSRGARRLGALVLRGDPGALAFWTALEEDGFVPHAGMERWTLALRPDD